MMIEIHKYNDKLYQITIPQNTGSIDLGNKLTKKESIKIISKMIDMMNN